jgi:hypothetical protein
MIFLRFCVAVLPGLPLRTAYSNILDCILGVILGTVLSMNSICCKVCSLVSSNPILLKINNSLSIVSMSAFFMSILDYN